MDRKVDSEELMLRYLLGDLPEEERVRLEERFFTDDEYYQQLVALEDELRYDYAQGRLSPLQQAQFKRRFLTTTADHEKLALAQVVLDSLAKKRVTSAIPMSPRRFGAPWVPWLKTWWRQPAWAFASAAILLIMAGSWLLFDVVRLRREVAQLQAEKASAQQQTAQQASQQERLQAQLESERTRRQALEQERTGEPASGQEQAGRRSSARSVFSFFLSPGLQRSAGVIPRLRVPTPETDLRLILRRSSTSQYPAYRIVLRTVEGEELWSQGRLPGPRDGDHLVTVPLPASLLTPGDYTVTLFGVAPDQAPAELEDYYFRVVR